LFEEEVRLTNSEVCFIELTMGRRDLEHVWCSNDDRGAQLCVGLVGHRIIDRLHAMMRDA
jgi:hypothetical protein